MILKQIILIGEIILNKRHSSNCLCYRRISDKMTFTNQCANQSFPFLSTTINDQHIQPSSIFQER